MGKLNRVATTLDKLAICACCVAPLLAATPRAAVAADQVVLQLHRGVQFEFAGYYAALWKGFYREAGIEVEIKPGAPLGTAPIDAVREVVERRAQFGTGTAQLLVYAAQGSPLVLLAPIFQRSGAAIYYRADGNFSSIRSLLGAKLGRPLPSNVLDLEFRTAALSEDIDPDKLSSVSIEPAQAIAALAERRVDAVVGSAWELPRQAQERSVAVKSFEFSGSRPEFYGDGLFTLQRFANAEPATVRRFRGASIRGWEYALQHPDEIAARIAELPAAVPVRDPGGFARYQSEVARKLARFPDVPLGHSDAERWNGMQQGLIAISAISHPVDLEGFLYESGEGGLEFTRRIALLIGVLAAVFGLFLVAAQIWRRPRRSGSLFAASPAPNRMVRALVHRALVHAGYDRMQKRVRHVAGPTGGGPPGAPPIDLNAALAGFEESIRRMLPRHIKSRLSPHPETRQCYADSDSVTALVRILVAEAIADMPKGGELAIGTRLCAIDHATATAFPGSVPGDYVRLTVRDSGLGLSAERLEKVFYPLKTDRPAAAAAWELTRRFGGFAAVESAQGIGTAVHIYFRAEEIAESAELPAGDLLHAAE
ncbi:MAG TPA: ABC transporter substrate-binding protein [Stellaceae bacterium]|nr:ABC transporter substrate-binding protein [Stellaceae bacterium]